MDSLRVRLLDVMVFGPLGRLFDHPLAHLRGEMLCTGGIRRFV